MRKYRRRDAPGRPSTGSGRIEMPGDSAPGPRQRRYLAVALSLVVFSVAAVILASRTDPSRIAGEGGLGRESGSRAPPLSGAKGWLNSRPLDSVELTDKVVLYDFWTYSCVNCVRTLPHLRSWHDRYSRDGLVVVGVHSPEFEFEREHDNVESATKRLGVTWPVALDDDKDLWDRFGTRYWPTKYLSDRDGRLRYRHIGEGAYAETEDALRALLRVDPASPRAVQPGRSASGTDPAPAGHQDITSETYLGTDRGTTGGQLGFQDRPEPGPLRRDQARLVGGWTAAAEKISSAEPGASVVMVYRAREVNLVLRPPASGPVEMVVELDGKPLPAVYRSSEIRERQDGKTVVRVDRADLYRLVVAPSVGDHTLRLVAEAPGLEAFAFTFGA